MHGMLGRPGSWVFLLVLSCLAPGEGRAGAGLRLERHGLRLQLEGEGWVPLADDAEGPGTFGAENEPLKLSVLAAVNEADRGVWMCEQWAEALDSDILRSNPSMIRLHGKFIRLPGGVPAYQARFKVERGKDSAFVTFRSVLADGRQYLFRTVQVGKQAGIWDRQQHALDGIAFVTPPDIHHPPAGKLAVGKAAMPGTHGGSALACGRATATVVLTSLLLLAGFLFVRWLWYGGHFWWHEWGERLGLRKRTVEDDLMDVNREHLAKRDGSTGPPGDEDGRSG